MGCTQSVDAAAVAGPVAGAAGGKLDLTLADAK
eukprot:SAG22_NODE_9652_length_577_cov_0.740586_2_plen_32_part_01